MTVAKPVLLIGSTGIIGSRVAQTLRELHPDLPLAIVGRDLSRAQEIADQLGNASAFTVDLHKKTLGFDDSHRFSAVAIFMKDDTLNSLAFAQMQKIPYMDISSAAFEIGPEVARFVQQPTASAVLMNSNWLAGTSTLIAMHFVRDYSDVQRITVSALLDSDDMGGAAADTDYERQTGAVTSALVLKDGIWQWLNGEAMQSTFTASDGTEHAAQAFSNLDVLSLASATNARNVRFEFAVGETPSHSEGKHFSHEIIITIEGTRKDGRTGTFRYEAIHPEGQAPMTALTAAIGIETLLGLTASATPVDAGLYLPHTLIDVDYALQRLTAIGTTIKEVVS